MRANVVFVQFKPNTHFEPKVLRDAAEAADTVFPIIQIVARGHVVEEGEKHFFLAGEDRFLLIEPPPAAQPLPAVDETVSVVASLDDSVDPARIKIVQTLPEQTPAPPQGQAGQPEHQH